MSTIQNKWIEKEKKKRVHETSPAYESDPFSDTFDVISKKPAKRCTHAARSVMVRTLRGVRK